MLVIARAITFVWACLTCTSIGRRLQGRSSEEHQDPSSQSERDLKHYQMMRHLEVSSQLPAFARLLLSFNSPLSEGQWVHEQAHVICALQSRSWASSKSVTMRLPDARSKARERRLWRRDMRYQLLLFAGPATTTVLADPLMSVVDAGLCGHFSTTLQLASLGPALAVFTFASYLFFFLNAATAVEVSKALANKDRDSASTSLTNALFIATSFGVTIATLLWFFAEPLVALTGCVPELIPTAAQYTRVRGIGQPVVLSAMVLQAGLLAQRDAITPANAVLFSCLVNIVGDLAWVPKLGAVGAAWATLVSQVLSLPLLLFLSARRKRLPIRLRLPDVKSLAPLLSASGPLFLFEMGLSTCYVMIQSLGTQFSVASTAAFQAIWNPLSFIGFCAFPLKQAAQVFLPSVLKEEPQVVGDRPKSREFFKILTALATFCGVLLAVASAGCAAHPALFTQDIVLWPEIRSFLPFVSCAMGVLPFAIAFEGVLLGTGDLPYLAQSQLLNVVASIATFCITKQAGMGVHGTWLVLIAFYVSRVMQGAIRILVTRKPWRT